jgi:tetratricopeptide (TPR) repeat protein
MNKLRIIFKCLPLLVLIFLISCSGGKDQKDNKVIADSMPADLAAISRQIQADPDNPIFYNQRAELYIQKQKPEEALTDINKAISIDAKNTKYYRTLSDVYFSMGKVQQCRDALNKAINIDDEDTNAYLKLGELEFYFKEYQKSFEFINKALELDPKNAKAFFMRGMSYKEMGDTAKAVKNFQIAVRNDQEYYHAFIQLGLIYATKHNPLAADYYNNALKLNHKSTEVYYDLGLYYQENEQYNKAIEAYTALLKIDPKFKAAHYNLGYIHLVYLMVYDVAARHFSDAINCDPNYAEAWYNRGYCYELLGNVMQAKADYQQAIKIKPNYQRAIDGMNRIDAIIRK